MTALIRLKYCTQCGREFRGVDPTKLLERHQAEERSAVVLAVSTGASS